MVTGDDTDDFINLELIGLSSGNFIALAPKDDTTWVDAGSAILIDGLTGEEITRVSGENTSDWLGNSAVELPTGNYLVTGSSMDHGGFNSAGCVVLVDGVLGTKINSICGDEDGEGLGRGYRDGGTTLYNPVILSNGNYVIFNQYDDVGVEADAGSAILVHGSGPDVGTEIAGVSGLKANDHVGTDIIALTNNNFVSIAPFSDNGADENTGVVVLVDGNDGSTILRHYGPLADDQFGHYAIPLADGNFAVGSSATGVGGQVVVFNGSDGSIIGQISGDAGDSIGTLGTTNAEALAPLANGNFAILSVSDSEAGMTDNGSLIVVDDDPFSVNGTVVGPHDFANLGWSGLLGRTGMTFAPNGNLIVIGVEFDIGPYNNASIAYLVDGLTGSVIYSLEGDADNDQLGDGDPFVLSNSNFVINSIDDDAGGFQSGTAHLLVND